MPLIRTTIDLPEELLRRVKVHAAERGLKLEDVFATSLEKELADARPKPKGRHRPIPVAIEGVDRAFPLRASAALFEATEGEERG